VKVVDSYTVAALTTVLNSCGHDTSGWSKLYDSDPDFATRVALWNTIFFISV